MKQTPQSAAASCSHPQYTLKVLRFQRRKPTSPPSLLRGSAEKANGVHGFQSRRWDSALSPKGPEASMPASPALCRSPQVPSRHGLCPAAGQPGREIRRRAETQQRLRQFLQFRRAQKADAGLLLGRHAAEPAPEHQHPRLPLPTFLESFFPALLQALFPSLRTALGEDVLVGVGLIQLGELDCADRHDLLQRQLRQAFP